MKVVRCCEFIILFQGENNTFYLPLVTIAQAIPILQKLLKTNLRLKIKVIKKDEFVEEDESFSLNLCLSRSISVSYYVNLLATINQQEFEFLILSNETIG